MIRGTTPQISFNIKTDIDLNEIEQVWVTFKGSYESKKEITYTKDDVYIDAGEKVITLDLSQEQTLFFNVGKVSVQLRLLLSDGNAWASDIKMIDIDAILKDGVIE